MAAAGIRAAFEDRGLSFEGDDAAEKAAQLAQDTGCPVSKLVRQYEAFAANREADTVVTLSLMDDFAASAQQMLAKQAIKTPQAGKRRSHAPSDITNSPVPALAAAVAAAPASRRPAEAPDQEPSPKVRKISVEGFASVQSFNGHLHYPAQAGDSDPCTVEVLGPAWDSEHRYMVDRLEDKVKHLSGLIEAATPRAEGEESVAAVHSQTQDTVTFCGRICCDSEGTLNHSSMLLEGSLSESQGHRVRLDVSRLEAFRTFPGQIVALQGSNATGAQITASSLCRPQPKPMAEQTPGSLPDSKPLAVLVAAGPFTGSAELSYEALDALLQQCSRVSAHALVLTGPFVDTEHPQVQAGSVDISFDQVFQEQVVERLKAWLQGSGQGKRVLLVPSTRDAHHAACLPQPAFAGELVSGVEGLHCLPSPATFSLNGVTFGVVSTDIVKHLSSAEVKHGPAQAERLACLMAHLVAQRSYYPLYPAAPGVMLDTSRAAHLAMPLTPDVLLLPSDLAAAARLTPASADVLPPQSAAVDPQAHNVLCVNPGRAVKGSAGGSCALLQLCPPAPGQDGRRVSQRTRVDVLRLQ